MLGVEFPDSYCDMDFEDQKFESVSVRHKGNGTFLNAGGTEKFSFKLDAIEIKAGLNIITGSL